MTRTILTAAIAFVAMAGHAQAFTEPTRESFTEAQRTHVLQEGARLAATPMSEVEDVDGMADAAAEAAARFEDAERRGVYIDDDATHYARGTTLILHVFIDHAGGSFEFDERQEAGAKASAAKDYFLAEAPTNAYLRFDNEGTTNYWMLQTTVAGDYSGATSLSGAVINEAVQNLGYGDGDADGEYTDDLTLAFQGWNGGWNNVIACFQLADVEGQAWASFERAYVKLYTNSYWQVWAHEWGHTFGACDEYASAGSSCVEECQSWYLNDSVPNGNCEDCAGLDTCLMKYNHENLCEWTPRNWAWRDNDGNGQLDRTVRYDSAFVPHDVWQLYHDGWMIHTNTDWSMYAPQRWDSWSVIGVRNRGTSDYDMTVYADVNQFHELASSSYPVGFVDFVVGDHNHNHDMETHISLDHQFGSGQYVLSYESGNGVIYPDGTWNNFTWDDRDVVRVWDVPLFGGESITFGLDIDTPGLDLGMAIFGSSGDVYYAGRLNALVQADVQIPGQDESFVFDVPDTDVYGLVVWANTEVDGDFTIQLDYLPLLLPEELPWTASGDPTMYGMEPDVPYWALIAARPLPGTNVGLRLLEDSQYSEVLATSGAYANVEFIAADYSIGTTDFDYMRTWMQGADGPGHTTEWEQSADLLTGFEYNSIGSNNVAKVWDVWLRGGEQYFFRQYNELGPLDCGIYAVSSADGDYYTQRSGADEGSNSNPPALNGEWFTWTAPADDYYAYAMIKNDESSGDYTVGFGPRLSLSSNIPDTYPEEVGWTDFYSEDDSWNVIAVRTEDTAESHVAMWHCNTYGSECFVDWGASTPGVQFMAVDGWGADAGQRYVRFQRTSGTGDTDISADMQERLIVYDDETEVGMGQGGFVAGEVAHVWDLFTTTDLAYPLDIEIRVVPEDDDIDLGLYVLDATSGDFQTAEDALGFADNGGTGATEEVFVTFSQREVHAIVVTNLSGTAREYDIRVSTRSSVDTEETGAPVVSAVGLRARSANPMRGPAVFDVELPAATDVELAVFDAGGRLVRSLANDTFPAGVHAMSWDGSDGFGRKSAAGVYLVRLRAGSEVKTTKVLRMN